MSVVISHGRLSSLRNFRKIIFHLCPLSFHFLPESVPAYTVPTFRSVSKLSSPANSFDVQCYHLISVTSTVDAVSLPLCKPF